jgi:hypothetical protein
MIPPTEYSISSQPQGYYQTTSMSSVKPVRFIIPIVIISVALLGIGWVLTGALLLLISPKLWELIMQENVRAVVDRATDQDSANMAEVQNHRPFEPFPVDVFVGRAMLAKARPALPPELIDIIFELAEYWPCSRAVRDFRYSSFDRIISRAVSSRSDSSGNEFLVCASHSSTLTDESRSELILDFRYDPRPLGCGSLLAPTL